MIINSPCISHSNFSVMDYTRFHYCNIRKLWYILIKERITVDVNNGIINERIDDY